MQLLVMTVIGTDRPGLVEMLADLVASHGGNWLESRLSHLGGQFAGMLRVQIPEERVAALSGELKNLSARGLTVVIQSDVAAAEEKSRSTAILELVGSDRPGIVQQISSALAGKGINVEELDTELVSAPMSGEMLFKAHARLHIPASCSLSELRSELEKIAQDLFVDVSLQPVNVS
ncbi:MAG: glycine cleavage system protein R [Verrucomicrobia bacterium]|nr:glycine cleavage system protein R [Verrucomicrobiota bacterium]